MKERGIIFNAEMVRAILDGRKTQTRRIVKDQCTGSLPYSALPACPFGQSGERLWVRETFSCIGNEDGHPVDANGDLCNREDAQRIYRASAIQKPRNYGLWTSPDGFDFEGTWTPSIHMPRWASRITLEITGVRVERLTALSDDDARNEGCPAQLPHNPEDEHQARTWFRGLWSEIYGEESWQANPWVWVVEFNRVEGVQP